MNKRDFVFSCIPGLEDDLSRAKGSMKKVDEREYQEWAKGFTTLPEPVLRELWEVKKVRDK